MSQPVYVQQVKEMNYEKGTVAYASQAVPVGECFPPPPPGSGTDEGVYLRCQTSNFDKIRSVTF